MSKIVIPRLVLGGVETGGGWGLGDNYTVVPPPPVNPSHDSSIEDRSENHSNNVSPQQHDQHVNEQQHEATPSGPSPAKDSPQKLEIRLSADEGPETPHQPNDEHKQTDAVTPPGPYISDTPMVKPLDDEPTTPGSPTRKLPMGSEVSSVIMPLMAGVKCTLRRTSTEMWFGGKDGVIQAYDLHEKSGELVEKTQIKVKTVNRPLGEDILRCMCVITGIKKRNGGEESQLWCGSSNGKIAVYSFEAKKNLDVIVGHGSAVLSMVFVKNNGRVWTSGADGFIRIWDVATRKLIARNPHKKAVRDLTLSTSTNHVWSCGMDGVISAWMLEGMLWKTISTQATLKYGPVVCLKEDRAENQMWSGGEKCVFLWDVTTGNQVWKCDQLNAHAIDLTDKYVIFALREAVGDSLVLVTRNQAHHVALRIQHLAPVFHVMAVSKQFFLACFGGSVGSRVSVYTLEELSLQTPTVTRAIENTAQNHPALDEALQAIVDVPNAPETGKSEDTVIVHNIVPAPKNPPPVVDPLILPSPGHLPPLMPSHPASAHAHHQSTPSSAQGEVKKLWARMDRKLDLLLDKTKAAEFSNDIVHLYAYAQFVKMDVLPQVQYDNTSPVELSTTEGRSVAVILQMLADRVRTLERALEEKDKGSPTQEMAPPQPPVDPTPLLLRILSEVTKKRESPTAVVSQMEDVRNKLGDLTASVHSLQEKLESSDIPLRKSKPEEFRSLESTPLEPSPVVEKNKPQGSEKPELVAQLCDEVLSWTKEEKTRLNQMEQQSNSSEFIKRMSSSIVLWKLGEIKQKLSQLQAEPQGLKTPYELKHAELSLIELQKDYYRMYQQDKSAIHLDKDTLYDIYTSWFAAQFYLCEELQTQKLDATPAEVGNYFDDLSVKLRAVRSVITNAHSPCNDEDTQQVGDDMVEFECNIDAFLKYLESGKHYAEEEATMLANLSAELKCLEDRALEADLYKEVLAAFDLATTPRTLQNLISESTVDGKVNSLMLSKNLLKTRVLDKPTLNHIRNFVNKKNH